MKLGAEMIEFRHVTCEYESGKPVLKDLSFELEKGECLGLIGANGAGKSTLIKALFGLTPAEGDILVEGVKLEKKTLPELRKKLGLVLQSSDNQMFMPRVFDDMLFGPMNYGLSREEAEKKALAVLEELNISELKDKYNHKISGGEKRMAAIATVLAMEPELLVMDEPTASLDPYNRRKVINAIKGRKESKLIASHDLDMILELCDRVLLLGEGEIRAFDTTEKILGNKKLLEANRLELPFCYMNRK